MSRLSSFLRASLIFAVWLVLCGPAFSSDRKWLERISALYDRGTYSTALEEADKYQIKFPADAEIACFRGWVLSKLGESAKAESAFDEALQLDPRWDNAYTGKGMLAKKSGDFKKAREFYGKAIEINPQDAHTLSSLASLELSLGNYPKASLLGEQAWELNKEDPVIAANLAIAYHYAGEHAKRDALFERAKELHYSSLDVLSDIFAGRKDIPVESSTK